MKRRILSISVLLAITAAAFAGLTPAADSGQLITVLSPSVTTRLATRVPLAPRLDTIEGKTIYLVDTNWGGMGQSEQSYGLIQEMAAWFAKNKPGVKTVIKVKRNDFVTDDPALWKEISDKKGDAVIIGVAG